MSLLRAVAGRNGEDGAKSEQEVCTPPVIIHAVVRAFGAPIALDPCAPSKSAPAFYAERYIREGDGPGGLGEPWVDRTFVNPPFATLQEWLDKMRRESRVVYEYPGLVPAGSWRTVVLCPLRSHRVWFRAAIADACATGGGITLLPGVRFVGHKANFPAPMCLLSWGVVVPFPGALTFASPPEFT